MSDTPLSDAKFQSMQTTTLRHAYDDWYEFAQELERNQARLAGALRSIADSTCCEGCQEASRVAAAALASLEEKP